MCRAVRAIKAAVPEIGVLCDVALDPYTSHGHDGLLRDGDVHNDATVAMLRHGFLDLNLHRIYLFVLKTNQAAIRVYEKAGFRHEGTLREAAFKGGAFQDLLVMGMIRSEFNPS